MDLITGHERYAGPVDVQAQLLLPEGCQAIVLEALGAMEAWLDGLPLGRRMSSPYHFDLPTCQAGEHTLKLTMIIPLVYRHRDPLSFFNYLQPVGLTGPVTLLGNKVTGGV